LRAVELDWVDEAGEPVVLDDPMLFAASRADGQQGEHLLDAVNGGVSSSIVLFSGAPTTIVVEDPNHTGSWSGPSSDRHVIMHSLPRTRFLVEGLPPAPAGSRWRICASAASGAANRVLNVGGQTGRRPGNWLRSEIDAEGRGELSLLARSRYEIELELTADNGRSRIELPATSGNVDTGEILPRELTFRFDAQKLQAAVH
jgi:hypothetical protein